MSHTNSQSAETNINYAKLDKETEFELIERYQKNSDKQASDTLIHSQLGLLKKYARKYSDNNNLQDELVNEGVLGLISALKKFDLTKGFRFSTYGIQTAVGFMKHYMRSANDLLDMACKSNDFNKIKNKIHSYDCVDWKASDVKAFAEQIKVKTQDIITILKTSSISQTGGFIDDEYVSNNAHLRIDDQIINDDLWCKIREFVGKLKDKPRDAFMVHYLKEGHANDFKAKYRVQDRELRKIATEARDKLVAYINR